SMPRPRAHLALLVAAGLLLAGCMPVNTVPAPVKPSDPVQQFELVLPGNLEVRGVDFSAALAGTGSPKGPSGVEGRGFLKVFAVDRDNGDSVLLIYENVAERKDP